MRYDINKRQIILVYQPKSTRRLSDGIGGVQSFGDYQKQIEVKAIKFWFCLQ